MTEIIRGRDTRRWSLTGHPNGDVVVAGPAMRVGQKVDVAPIGEAVDKAALDFVRAERDYSQEWHRREKQRADQLRDALARIERVSGWSDHDGELAVQIAREALASTRGRN